MKQKEADFVIYLRNICSKTIRKRIKVILQRSREKAESVMHLRNICNETTKDIEVRVIFQ